jgi:uncharacterized Zn finger protein
MSYQTKIQKGPVTGKQEDEDMNNSLKCKKISVFPLNIGPLSRLHCSCPKYIYGCMHAKERENRKRDKTESQPC